ncbi:DUF397 domain-containing protein [Saccharopolyspora sp. MS10]|uniref:DUF397 domain-containing protein n=1 Tax=Saccharopolyspora sp. MS10 TaxID=3385973 RepID=UPI0039A00ECA
MTVDIREWRKSSRSAQQGSCVEVGGAPGLAAVRDTKDRRAGTLIFTTATWASFPTALRDDRLAP